MLDKASEMLAQRVANKVYELCRSGTLSLPGFPEYTPLINALRNTENEGPKESYEVCVRKHDKLLILQSYAEKWLNSSEFSAEARELLEEHNKHFNRDGEWWAEAEVERTDSEICLNSLVKPKQPPCIPLRSVSEEKH